MASERRFLLSFAISDRDGNFTFLDTRATIEGDLEKGIEGVKRRVMDDLNKEGVHVEQPVLLTALQLDSIRPPDWVQLPVMVRRSIEQVVLDWGKSRPMNGKAITDIAKWLTEMEGDE